MKRIFITGANGFIGKHLVNYLSGFDYLIYALIRENSIPEFFLKRNIRLVYGDVTDIKTLENAIPKYSIVINLAANPYHKSLSYQVNVEGVKNLISVCQKKKIIKFIQLSSQATKLKKMGVYGLSKKLADDRIVNSSLRYVILKPSLVYGEGEKGLFGKVKAMLAKFPIVPIFASERITINPIYIRDLVKLIKLIVDDDKAYNIVYEPGSTEFISYQKFYKAIAKNIDKRIYLIRIPALLGVVLSTFFSFFKKPPFYIDNVLGTSQDTKPNPFPICKKYKYKPLNFTTGMKEIFREDKVNVAIVGLGKMGMLHAGILNTLANTKITALIDQNKSIHKTIKTMGLNASLYSSLSEALKCQKIDAVFITTPTFTHFDLIKETLKNKINIFVEKPVVLNQNQIDYLREIKTDLIIHTGYTLLFKRTFNKVKQILDSGKFGQIISFKAFFEHTEVLGPKKGWMFEKKKSGGGVLMNPGPHLFSLINYYFGKPQRVESFLKKRYSQEVEDEAQVNLHFKNFKGYVFLSWSVENRLLPYYFFKIKCTRATLTVDANKITIKKGNKITIISERDIKSEVYPIFNVNPASFGECYFVEDRLFMNSILAKSKITQTNSLKNALETESVIQMCYKNNINL